MKNFPKAIAGLGDALADVAAAAFAADGLRGCEDEELLRVLAGAARVRRGADALISEAVAQLMDRDDHRPHADRVTTRYGCRNAGELVQRATRMSGRTAAEVIVAAHAVQEQTAPSTGEVLPAEFPRMREALQAAEVGIDGVAGVGGVFRGSVVGRAGVLAADQELAAAACANGLDGAPPASADQLRGFAQVWVAYLDADGAEPAEHRSMRKRGVTVGRRGRDGLVPLRGALTPDVAAKLQLGFDSVLNPKLDPVPGPRFIESDEGGPDGTAEPREPAPEAADTRTRAQKQHDALAVLLGAAAASGGLPTLGGAAPTLVVSVREEDLATGRGRAHLPGDDAPIPLALARQIACTGAVQRVVTARNGRIVSIEILDRVFNYYQRRAITQRDGGCLIPGCPVPPQWCEIHHVEEHSRGGPTSTDNGVLLCWFHHRTIDVGGWEIRTNNGVPEVRGPYWWDPQRRWRPATKSATRQLDRLALRR